MNLTYAQVKARVILLGMTLQEFATHLNVSYVAFYKALKGDPFMGKLRKQIPVELDKLERQRKAA